MGRPSRPGLQTVARDWPDDIRSDIGPLSSFAEALSPSASERYAAGFKKFGPLAQSVEHLTLNQGVEGSSPSRLINFPGTARKIYDPEPTKISFGGEGSFLKPHETVWLFCRT